MTHGIFSIDGEDFEVDNNIWIVGDDDECLVIDAAHEVGADRRRASADRQVRDDRLHARPQRPHQRGGRARRRAATRPIALHPDDRMLWDVVHPDRAPDVALDDGGALRRPAASTLVDAPHPGPLTRRREPPRRREHAGVRRRHAVQGRPGRDGRSFSDFPTIIESIRTRLLTLPADTVVHTGHGDSTRIGDEAPHLDEWIARGS